MVAFNEIEVWILHFFKLACVGLATRRPPVGAPPGGVFHGRSRRFRGLEVLISCRINELRVR